MLFKQKYVINPFKSRNLVYMNKKIVKTKILIFLSFCSINPALASNYQATSTSKITVKISKSRGYQLSNNLSQSDIKINNESDEDSYLVSGKGLDTGIASNDNISVKQISNINQNNTYQIAIVNE